MAVGFEPVVEEHLVKIRRHDFFAQLVSFNTQKWHAQARQCGDQGLRDLVGIGRAVRVL